MSALRIQSLFAGYGASTVLRGIDLTVEEGESVALVGRNGAGKSTLLLSVFRETNILSGEIWVRDRRIDGLPGYTAAKLGVSIAPQGRRILPNLTVKENLFLPPAIARTGAMSAERIYALFPNLRERLSSGGGKLSGGEQQMLAIARILRTGARFLMLDEPTEGLAPVIIQQIGRTIAELKRDGFTILLVEQNFRFASTLADRFFVMEHGKIIDAFANDELAGRMDKLHETLGV